MACPTNEAAAANIHRTTLKAAHEGFCSLSSDSEVFFPIKKPSLSELEEEEHDFMHSSLDGD